jgi:hypothetical protein
MICRGRNKYINKYETPVSHPMFQVSSGELLLNIKGTSPLQMAIENSFLHASLHVSMYHC